MAKKTVVICAVALVLIILFSFSWHKSKETSTTNIINDVSRLNPTHVKEIIKNQEVQGIKEALAEARKNNIKVSIAGKKHSMGGHAFYKDAVVLDMTSFNKILAINPAKKMITIQSGVTWEQIENAINPYNLSVEVMQAYNTFTIGGSLSVNVHESDPRYGPLIETVKSFRLLLANGTVVNANRSENKDLFGLAIGGYGLFGVILDVDLQLTDNAVYEKEEHVLSYEDYPGLLINTILNKSGIEQAFARLSIAPDESFLNETIVTTYHRIATTDEHLLNLESPSKTSLKKFLFGLSRKYSWGKTLRWYLQKKYSNTFEKPIISRNNLMNTDISFLEYNSPATTDVLQEYFIPMNKLKDFIDKLRELVMKNDINLLSATIRYVPENTESLLSYSPHESFGIVIYINQGISDQEVQRARNFTQQIVDAALEENGTYYLPYQLYPTKEQFRHAYSQSDAFFAKKKIYDPKELFMNQFYAKYALGEEK